MRQLTVETVETVEKVETVVTVVTVETVETVETVGTLEDYEKIFSKSSNVLILKTCGVISDTYASLKSMTKVMEDLVF